MVYKTIKRFGNRLGGVTGRLTTSEWITAIFTAIIALATIWNVCVVKSSLHILQGQLNEMENDQRPWVSFASNNGFGILSSLTFQAKEGANMRVNYSLRNTGHSPALAVRFRAKLVTLEQKTYSTIEIARQESELCDPLRKQTSDFDDITIFPGDLIQGNWPVELSQVEINEELTRRNSGPFAHPGFISIYLIACIDYQGASLDSEHYQTRYSFLLGVPLSAGSIMADLKPDPGARPDVKLIYFTQSAD